MHKSTTSVSSARGLEDSVDADGWLNRSAKGTSATSSSGFKCVRSNARVSVSSDARHAISFSTPARRITCVAARSSWSNTSTSCASGASSPRRARSTGCAARPSSAPRPQSSVSACGRHPVNAGASASAYARASAAATSTGRALFARPAAVSSSKNVCASSPNAAAAASAPISAVQGTVATTSFRCKSRAAKTARPPRPSAATRTRAWSMRMPASASLYTSANAAASTRGAGANFGPRLFWSRSFASASAASSGRGATPT
mmetsp:Transcript_34335/g.106146  ORF Transcript_34335/g.106146 Transcript_34335/m.106146 type:complete len:260 (+) Transcript_34335:213-992(+)